MADDLYSLWLKIPPGPRPPDFYALLGLDPSRADAEKIEAAAQNQLDILDRYSLHPDPPKREACYRMMNEVARARVVLTNASQRAEYERTLAGDRPQQRNLVGAGSRDVIGTISGTPSLEPGNRGLSRVTDSIGSALRSVISWMRNSVRGADPTRFARGDSRLRPSALRTVISSLRNSVRGADPTRSQPGKGWRGRFIAITIAGIAIGVGVVLVVHYHHQSHKPSANITHFPAPIAPPARVVQTSRPSKKPIVPVAKAPAPVTRSPAVGSPARRRVPDADALAGAEKLVNALYKSELAGAQTGVQMSALASKMIALAPSADINANERYVQIELAGNLATKAMDIETAMVAIDVMGRDFEIDVLHVRARAMATIARLLTTGQEHRALANCIDAEIDQALAANRYDLAHYAADTACFAARAVKDDLWLQRALFRQGQVQFAEAEFGKAKP